MHTFILITILDFLCETILYIFKRFAFIFENEEKLFPFRTVAAEIYLLNSLHRKNKQKVNTSAVR